MTSQQILEDSIEKMGVALSKHPSGTVTVAQGGELFHIFPHENRWTFKISRYGEVNAYQSGFYTYKDVDLMVYRVLRWAWDNGAQGGLYRG